MRALRPLCLSFAIILTSIAPAAAQRPQMSPGLVKDLRNVEVQKQLIALGVLDATAGRASRRGLREAMEWFRRAYPSAEGLNPLTQGEKQKLKEAYDKFLARTGLKLAPYRDPESGTEVKLRLPVAFVGNSPQKGVGDLGHKWQEYRAGDNKVSVGPELHLVSQVTPIALFRERIMSAALRYTHLHLTSMEFTAQGDAGGETDGYSSSSLVLTFKDQLKGVFMRYAKQPPASFEVPDFLLPVIATEPSSSGVPKVDQTARGWQLLMQGVANLIISEFPFDNGWKAVSSQPCPLSQPAAAGEPKSIRILFGTDRKAGTAAQSKGGPIADPDSLFANEPANRLHLGCAYVSVPPMKEGEETRDLRKSRITGYQWLHTTDRADFGDQLHLVDEIAESRPRRAKVDRSRAGEGRNREGVGALVFVHGYNVAFADALFTVSQIVSATNYPGRVYMYSWPSARSTLGYIGDMDNAEQAEPFLQSFMRLLMRDADIDEIDVLVHSMGSQSVLRALSALRSVFETQRQGRSRPKDIRIGQIIFAAPDVAMPVFDQKIQRIAPFADRVTVFVSSTDAALLASTLLRSGASRMGELDGSTGQPRLIEIKNVHIIDATGPERWWRLDRILFGQGHDYFAQSPAVLKDIRRILEAGGQGQLTTPKVRSGDLFDEVSFKDNKDGWVFWKLK